MEKKLLAKMFMKQQKKTAAKKEKISLPVCKSKKWLVKGVDLSDSKADLETLKI